MRQKSKSEWQSWIPGLWMTVLFMACYAVVLARLAEQWMSDEAMSHGILVLPLVAWIVWQRRKILIATPASPSVWGLLLLLIGAVLLCIGPPSLTTFTIVTRLAFLVSLVGLLLYLRGFSTVRRLAYPLLLLLFMIPLPGFVLERITLPLQTVASIFSERVLEMLGYSVLREGNILRVPGQSLEVAEACSGLRSLLALSFGAQAYIYMFDNRSWMRAVAAVIIVPIAIFANTGRILFTAIVSRHDSNWLGGPLHDIAGWSVFVIAFAALVIFHWLFNRLYIRYSRWRLSNADPA